MATATPASSGSQPRRAGGTAGFSSTETVSAARGGEVQVPAYPAATRALLLGGQHRALRLAGQGPGQQVGVGRAGALDDLGVAPQAAGA